MLLVVVPEQEDVVYRSGKVLILATSSLIGSSTPPALDLSPARVQNLGDLPISFNGTWGPSKQLDVCNISTHLLLNVRVVLIASVAPAFRSRSDSMWCRRCSKLWSDVTLQDLLFMRSPCRTHHLKMEQTD